MRGARGAPVDVSVGHVLDVVPTGVADESTGGGAAPTVVRPGPHLGSTGSVVQWILRQTEDDPAQCAAPKWLEFVASASDIVVTRG